MTGLPSDVYVRFGPGGVAGVSSTVRLTGHSYIYCHTYDDSAPILSIDDAHVKVSISVPEPGQVSADDVARGRKLAEAVSRYVAELERRAATGSVSAAGPGDAAGRAA